MSGLFRTHASFASRSIPKFIVLRMNMKILAAILFAVLSLTVYAEGPINADAKGLFLEGYDVVSYFNADEPSKGDARFSSQFSGVTLWFSSAENRNQFVSNPDKYWPQFAGHCANGLSDGHLVRANPKIYRIIDDQLYLFFSWWGKAQWKYNQQEQIQLANETWQLVLDSQER